MGDYVWDATQYLKWHVDRFRGVTPQRGEMSMVCAFFVCSSAQLGVKPLDRFWRVMSQNACFWKYCIPLGVRTTISQFHGVKIPQNRQKLARIGIFQKWFWDPPDISGTAEDTNLEFCMRIEGKGYWTIKLEMGQKGAWPKSRDLLFKFWDPPDVSGTADDTNLKFCMRIEGKGYYTKKWKIGQKVAWPRSRDLLFIFCDPPLERLKMQTSNFACRLIINDTKPENEK